VAGAGVGAVSTLRLPIATLLVPVLCLLVFWRTDWYGLQAAVLAANLLACFYGIARAHFTNKSAAAFIAAGALTFLELLWVGLLSLLERSVRTGGGF